MAVSSILSSAANLWDQSGALTLQAANDVANPSQMDILGASQSLTMANVDAGLSAILAQTSQALSQSLLDILA